MKKQKYLWLTRDKHGYKLWIDKPIWLPFGPLWVSEPESSFQHIGLSSLKSFGNLKGIKMKSGPKAIKRIKKIVFVEG